MVMKHTRHIDELTSMTLLSSWLCLAHFIALSAWNIVYIHVPHIAINSHLQSHMNWAVHVRVPGKAWPIVLKEIAYCKLIIGRVKEVIENINKTREDCWLLDLLIVNINCLLVSQQGYCRCNFGNHSCLIFPVTHLHIIIWLFRILLDSIASVLHK